jgi:hypothetical protein
MSCEYLCGHNFYSCSLLASCVAWFRVDTWVAIFSIVFIDGKIIAFFIVIYYDAASSIAAASYMGTLEKV